MGFKLFLFAVVVRLVLVMTALSTFVFLIVYPGYHAASLLLGGITIGLIFNLYSSVAKTNSELVRFLDAARYADFGQRFHLGHLGAGFEELGETFTAILDRFREERTEREADLRHLKALIEHVPVPLLSIHDEGTVTIWNNAARRLFANIAVARVSDLKQFSGDFQKAIETTKPGGRTLAPFQIDGVERQLTVAVTQVVVAGKLEKLVSLQDIQSELDVAQISAWQDLVRVLTHEIMNSITPVASLARTAVDVVDDARSKLVRGEDVTAELEDASGAVETVVRRSDGLMRFVSSYRRLTRLPSPQKSRFVIFDLFQNVERLVRDELEAGQISLVLRIEPDGLEMTADRGMIEQILINLIQNAVQALATQGVTNPELHLLARLNRRGHVVIVVADNGPGVPNDVAPKVFVPFYTTKREGSGVGLALTRQVMISHGGHVRLSSRTDEDAIQSLPEAKSGAVFTLTF